MPLLESCVWTRRPFSKRAFKAKMYLLSSADPAAVPWKRDHPYQIFPSVLTGSRQPKLTLESFLCPLKQSPLSLLMLSSSPRGPPAPSSPLG